MAVETPPILNPVALGQVVARNIVPVAGVIAFGWPAFNVLLLYFVDTMLSMGVMFAGLASYFSRESTEPGLAARINGEAGAIAVAVFLCVFIAVPARHAARVRRRGVALGRLRGAVFRPLARRGDRLAGRRGDLVVLGTVAGAQGADTRRGATQAPLRARDPALVRDHRGRLPADRLPVRAATFPFLLVLLYAGTTIFIEIAPDRFLRMMPGGAEDADPPPAAPPKRYSRTKKG
jgi:hypothetical protein